ncbi:hypothetical protein QVD17_26809 [Tagetes erecta]|uniref:Uncharacterized protein n=1 Tax=Tagetes erecta TaxID=13708 RepID=A0AAD8NIV8_TARER|nr:hypothetical protein QVD17_26809 [Tagetes erecta]
MFIPVPKNHAWLLDFGRYQSICFIPRLLLASMFSTSIGWHSHSFLIFKDQTQFPCKSRFCFSFPLIYRQVIFKLHFNCTEQIKELMGT